jgi:hypothetical protein
MPHAGKTTNLGIIHQRLKPEFRGQSRTIPMGNCIMHLCEFQPPGGGSIPGFTLRFHLYTLAAAEVGDPQWRMVLKGADGIVFVAESDPAKSTVTRTAFAELLGQMNSLGLDLSQVPIIVQANFQDTPGALDEQGLLNLLAVPGITVLPATAVRGAGVLETLATVVRKVTTILQKQEIVPQVEEDGEMVAADDAAATTDLADGEEDDDTTAALEVVALDTVQAGAPSLPVASLTADGSPLEIPLRLSVGGVERQFVMTVTIREAGAMQCEPLRGAGYVR